MNPLRKYNHINWALADQGMISLVNFTIWLLFARSFDLDSFGILALVWSLALFSNALQNALLISPMISMAPKQSASMSGKFYCTMFIFQLIFILLMLLVQFSGVTLAQRFGFLEDVSFLNSYYFALGSFLLNDFIRRMFFSQGDPQLVFWLDVSGYLLQLGTLFFVIGVLNLQLSADLALEIMGSFYLVAALLGLLRASFKSTDLEYLIQKLTKVFHYSKWLFPSAILQFLSGYSIMYIFAYMLGPWAAGVFKVIQSLLGMTNILLQGLENIVFPRAAVLLKKQGRVGLDKYLLSCAKIGGAAMLVILIVISIFGQQLMLLTYGQKYVQYAPHLSVMAAGYFAVYFFLPLHAGLRVLGKTKAVFVGQCWAALFGTLIVTLFVYYGGIIGGLIAWDLSWLALIISLFLAYRQRGENLS